MKTIKYIHILSLFVIIFVLNACTEEFTLKVDSTYARLVVYGEITTDTMAHSVSLTKSLDYFDPQEPEGISGAIVTLYWDSNTLQLTENDTVTGLYQTPPYFYGETGKLYRLTIENIDFDNDGEYEFYEAESLLKNITVIDSVNYKDTTTAFGRKVVQVNLWAQDPPTQDYYLFKWRRNDTLMTALLGDWSIIDDMFFNGSYIDGFTITSLNQSRDEEKLENGDLFTLEIASITKEYYDFIIQCFSVIGMQTPMTSSTPGNVKSNIGSNVVGFFTAHSISRASFLYKKNED